MSRPFHEFEQRIGYTFHNENNLRRALTCQSAINERHPRASNENFEVFELLGDAALKYAIAAILHNEWKDIHSPGDYHDKIKPYVSNNNLARIGRELNLGNFIIKGRGISSITDRMLGDAVEAILGAIVIDQQQQGNAAEDTLFDVIARLFSIERTASVRKNNNKNKEKTSLCCKCLYAVIGSIIFLVVLVLVIDQVDL